VYVEISPAPAFFVSRASAESDEPKTMQRTEEGEKAPSKGSDGSQQSLKTAPALGVCRTQSGEFLVVYQWAYPSLEATLNQMKHSWAESNLVEYLVPERASQKMEPLLVKCDVIEIGY